MKTIFWVCCVLVLAAVLVPAAFGQGNYQELNCGHRTQFDPQNGGYAGVWVTTDPAVLVTSAGEVQIARSLVVGYAPFELQGVSDSVTWSCYFQGEMPQERKWELVRPLNPASFVQVFDGEILVEQVSPDTTWTPVPPTATATLKPTQTGVSPTATPVPPTETPVPEYIPFHLEFWVNGNDVSGDDVVTSDPFDLIMVLYSDNEYTSEVQIEFEGINTGWKFNQPDGLSGTWGNPNNGKIEWVGNFPGNNKPVELWINVPPIQGERSFTATVYLEDGVAFTKTVKVTNPVRSLYLPLIGK